MKMPRDVHQVLYHGASPGRWSSKGATILQPEFNGGCFMTPNPGLASMYCADWQSRNDKVEFLRAVIDDFLEWGDVEEIYSNGLIIDGCDENSSPRIITPEEILESRSAVDISHYLVRRTVATVHHYPEGSVVFALRLKKGVIKFIDCKGNYFSEIPGDAVGINREKLSTDEVVLALRGQVDIIWFMNIIDPAHMTSEETQDVVYVYSRDQIIFHIESYGLDGW
jgi:hypothetical protein